MGDIHCLVHHIATSEDPVLDGSDNENDRDCYNSCLMDLKFSEQLTIQVFCNQQLTS
jgi:hypothetical protein